MQERRIQKRMSLKRRRIHPKHKRIHPMHKLQRVKLRKLNLRKKMKLRSTKRSKKKLRERMKKQKRQKTVQSRYISRSSIRIMLNSLGTKRILNYSTQSFMRKSLMSYATKLNLATM